MATGLVKWWRARFLAGYKPFSVVGGNTEGSDSEELLASVAAACNSSSSPSPPPPPPPPPSHPISTTSHSVSPQVAANTSNSPTQPVGCDDKPPSSNATKQLSFEEFECDVSVADGDRRRQEFSFTLYDFDGHGKITKDDIAGLVTTIYDTLGASIQVPPCGSKTIKVKLTVSPDQRSNQTTRSTCLNSPQAPTNFSNSPCCHFKYSNPPPVHTTVHCTRNNTPVHSVRHGLRRIPRRRRVVREGAQTEQKEAETQSEEDAENTRVHRVKQEEVRRRVGPVPHLPSPYSNSSEGDISDDSDTSPAFSPLTPLLTSNQRRRSGAVQRQQLLEIIQANMEKNNLSFHTSRKRHQNDPLRSSTQNTQVDPLTPYSQNCRPPSESRQSSTAYHKPVRETSTHHTVSFPKLPAKTRGNLRKTRVQHGVHRNVVTQPSRAHVQAHVLTRNIINPSVNMTTNIANDLHVISNTTRNVGNVTTPNANNQQTVNHSSSNNYNNSQRVETTPPQNMHPPPQQQPQPQSQPQSQPRDCSKGSKKHQLKHATREQDQARAMAQVVRWLEREFSQTAAAATATGASRRHVHEHIHHHYHHYHAEALV